MFISKTQNLGLKSFRIESQNKKQSSMKYAIGNMTFCCGVKNNPKQLSDILFFSGSFNPIHKAHIFIANDIKEKLACSTVVLVPAWLAYHKNTDTNTSFEDKIEMTKLASLNLEGFEVSDIDKRANIGNSYSYNTVKRFIEELPFKSNGEKLNFLIGADAFAGLPKWYNFHELSKLVKFIVSSRFGQTFPDIIAKKLKNEIPELNYQIFNEDIRTEISSSQIRKLIQEGKSTEEYLDKNVLSYIQEHNLYRGGVK
ncbi:MAG: nicotinate (nicotinamide) nucleotide adenylyltransferase [bacterium]|nr:nicotinate (nicotinamide) nucleotide adenylyltransferase [bacterium]